MPLFQAKKKKKVAGPCKVKDCKKCNLTGKKCKVCIEGFKPKKKGKKCGPSKSIWDKHDIYFPTASL